MNGKRSLDTISETENDDDSELQSDQEDKDEFDEVKQSFVLFLEENQENDEDKNIEVKIFLKEFLKENSLFKLPTLFELKCHRP